MSNRLSIEGEAFGRWTVLSFTGLDKRQNSLWLCSCVCGTSKVVRGHHLRAGGTQSCGCLQRERAAIGQRTHNHTSEGKRSREYRSWESMLRRCLNPNSNNYDNYGGRGIGVCSKWFVFESFYQDMGHRPPDTSLNRIDNDGDYSLINCNWATATEQSKNRRNNRE